MRAFHSLRRSRLTTAVECGLTADFRRRPWAAFLGMTALALVGSALPAFATTYLVDTAADVPTQNKTTLREAVSQANLSSDNFVEFAPALSGSTITLTQGEIPVNQPMTIVGPGADKLTISGNGASRIFNISTISNTQQQAMMTSTFFFLTPMIYLSGFIFPIENMPVVIQWFTYLIPLRYFLVILRSVFLKGVGLETLWPQALALAGWGLAILALATLRSSKRLS